MYKYEIKIKSEPENDEINETSLKSDVNNIKKEKEVEFVLILPPRQVKVEIEEEKSETKRNEKKFDCQQCPKSFGTRPHMIRHEQTHKPKVECQICSKKISKRQLKDHLKTHEDSKEFNCDNCPAGYVKKRELNRHMLKHLKFHVLSHSNNLRPFQCDLCPKNYTRKHDIQIHLTAIHSNLRFNCDQCEFKAKWKNNLYQHKICHSREKRFSCSICKKQFRSKQNIRVHQLVHTTTKDFECKICGKMFKSRESLKHHERDVHGKNLRCFCFKLQFNFFFHFSCRKEVHLQQMSENFQNKT
jgi:KRAB domain-containing zinc finger protein